MLVPLHHLPLLLLTPLLVGLAVCPICAGPRGSSSYLSGPGGEEKEKWSEGPASFRVLTLPLSSGFWKPLETEGGCWYIQVFPWYASSKLFPSLPFILYLDHALYNLLLIVQLYLILVASLLSREEKPCSCNLKVPCVGPLAQEKEGLPAQS